MSPAFQADFLPFELPGKPLSHQRSPIFHSEDALNMLSEFLMGDHLTPEPSHKASPY